MTETSPLARAIKRRMDAAGISAVQLTQLAGLNSTAMHDILSGRARNPRTDTMEKIATVLGCKPSDIYRDIESP